MIGANSQDGFLTTVLALEQGDHVLALTRHPDLRLKALEGRYPKLKYKWNRNYLLDLPKFLASFCPSHVFHFASNHAPSGATKVFVDSTDLLTRTVPLTLITIAKKLKFGITFPLSSRIYSGHLEGATGPVVVDADTSPNPQDYYGEGKVALLRISELAREGGVYVHSPILFNHGSIFSKPGYVSHAIASFIASAASSSGANSPVSHPHLRVDLSNAFKVAEHLLKSVAGANKSEFLGSGITPRISELIREQTKVVSGWLGAPVSYQLDTPRLPAPVITASESPLHQTDYDLGRSFAWLGGMAYVKLMSSNLAGTTALPLEVQDSLPLSFRRLPVSQIASLAPRM